MQRVTTAVSVILLVLVCVAVAEAALLAMLVLFAYILHLNFGAQFGYPILQLWSPPAAEASVLVRTAGIVTSALFTLGCGVGAAIWRYRQWRPA